MPQSLSRQEAATLLEVIYANGLNIAVEELEPEVTKKFADVSHLPKGFFVVLRTKESAIAGIGPVFRQGNDDNRHGLQRIHVSKENELTDEVISGSIRSFLENYQGATTADADFWKKTGSYSKEKALNAILKA